MARSRRSRSCITAPRSRTGERAWPRWARRTGRSSTAIRSRRAPSTSRIFATSGAGIATRRCGPSAPGSTSSMSMPTHDLSIAQQFLERRKNDRTDEYGGSLENRVRLLRELIEDTKEAVGDRCAVAVRFCADELLGDGRADPRRRSARRDRDARRASRSVGRQHLQLAQRQPDLALRQGGVPGGIYELREDADDQAGGRRRPLHLARHDGVPDQARDPRLHRRRAAVDRRSVPAQEDRGRAGSTTSASASAATSACRATTPRPTCAAPRTRPWARSGGAGWHPEIIPPKKSEGSVLVVGAGPAGLEAALSAARRGFEVHLAEADVRAWRPGQPRKPAARACRNGRGCATGGSASWSGWRTSRSIATAR